MAESLEIILRATIGFAVLLILVRLVGNKQLGQVNVFTYISGIAVGSMIGEIIIHRDVNMWISMIGLAVWVGLIFVTEIIGLKSVKARELLDGQPVILIKKGRIMYQSLKKERLNIDDLTMMLRTNQIFSFLDVDYAILEPNGDLSILKKQGKENLTKEDMQIPDRRQNHIPTAIIMDGSVIEKNLKELNLSHDWLSRILDRIGIKQEQNILYAELQGDGQLYVQMKDGCIHIGA